MAKGLFSLTIVAAVAALALGVLFQPVNHVSVPHTTSSIQIVSQ